MHFSTHRARPAAEPNGGSLEDPPSDKRDPDDKLLDAEVGRRKTRNQLGWFAGLATVALTTGLIVVLVVRALGGTWWGLSIAVPLIAGLAEFARRMLAQPNLDHENEDP